MVHSLGARTKIEYSGAKLFIPHPATGHSVWLFPDSCHMLKNARNALVEMKMFTASTNQTVDWAHILGLCKIQEDQGLHYANKLTARHFHTSENKMNVRLAAQVLSNSVSKALMALEKQNIISGCNI
ncbi:uncharacterized protein LOC113371333 [Ctenocephalides felis]|uniref:uncharacterized protein LOC113371333 n=1 Tax=Ctenocephalides felis TaxID=7515 RepID=UPI000E6E36AD|nr:uncharacterized protein LOC113371333 [Ctenocephalides felis]